GGVVDDAERVFKLMRNFRRESPGGLELLLAQRKFARLSLGAALTFNQDLDAVATGSHQHQQRNAEQKWFGRVVSLATFQRRLRDRVKHAVFPAGGDDVHRT